MAESELSENLDASHEAALREYFTAQLDGQIGRAESAFWSHLAEEGQMPPRPRSLRLPNRFGGWMVSVVGVALAASLGALWAGPSLVRVAPRPSVVAPPESTPVNNPVLVGQDPHLRALDSREDARPVDQP